MSTLDINAIRDYLLKVGCKIEYPILVNAFKQHLYNPDPSIQGEIRTRFKDYVNRLATVSLENNMKFIILRPEFAPTQQQKPAQTQQQPSLNEKPPLKLPEVKQQQQQTLPPQQPVKLTKLSSPVTQMNPILSRPIQQQLSQPAPQQPIPPPVPQHQRAPHIEHLPKQPAFASSPKAQLAFSQPVQAKPRQHSLAQAQTQYSTQSQQYHQQQQNQPAIQKQQVLMHQQISPVPKLIVPPHYTKLEPVLQTNNNNIVRNNIHQASDVSDGAIVKSISAQESSTPPPVTKRSQLLQRPESLNLKSSSTQMPPPRPPPRRRQSTASLFKQSPKPIEKSREIHDLAKKSQGRVKEHASKLNSFNSLNSLNSSILNRSGTMKENRLSKESTICSLSSSLQRNGSYLTIRSRSSHREDESDSSSLQPIDPLRRKWAIEACNRNYTGLLSLLKEDPKLASYKDVVSGYTALHWAAKFGSLDIIRLIAGTYSVSVNLKSSAGYTPLHIAYMFNRPEVVDLLIRNYKANPNIRDHSGKRPLQYANQAPKASAN